MESLEPGDLGSLRSQATVEKTKMGLPLDMTYGVLLIVFQSGE